MTGLQETIHRLFDIDAGRNYSDCISQIRELLRSPSYWDKQTPDTIHERIGSGSYGDVFRGTRSRAGCQSESARDYQGSEVAIKTVKIPNEESLLNAVREFVIQDLIYNCYDQSATKEQWAPVHHPFPTLYGVVGHKFEHHYELRGSMFLFQPGVQTDLSHFQSCMQVASVLCHLHTTTAMRFMHRDLHWNNVMRRQKSKHVRLRLWGDRNKAYSLVKEERHTVSRVFDCGAEAAVIDFGLAWLQLPDGQVLSAKTRLYSDDCSFNSQHDLRLLLVSAYYQLCVDPMSFKALTSLGLFATFVANLVDKARQQSPDFAMRTSLSTIRRIRTHLSHSRLAGKTFDQWFLEDIKTPFLDGKSHQWVDRFLPFLQEHRHIWKSMWGSSNPTPPLTHFLYGKTILITDTPCFEPAAVLNAAASAMIAARLKGSLC